MHDVVVNFKVHRVKQIYSDLRLYDGSREQLSQFAILKPQTIEYHFMVQCLCKNGYTGSAELYYLPPLSEPATGLVHIAGEEDIKKMMTVHAEKETRNCHLYIVGGLYDDAETAYGYLDGLSTCFCSQHSSEYFAMR